MHILNIKLSILYYFFKINIFFSVGYIEIYNEKIYDLLNKKNQDLKIHETANGIITVNCEEMIITCEEDLLHHLTQGSKERTVGETNMNERSSRSHAIFRIVSLYCNIFNLYMK